MSTHLSDLKRGVEMIWAASPRHTALWFALLVVQGFVPGAYVYLSKFVVDSLVAAVNDNGSWTSISSVIFYVGIAGSVMIIAEISQSLLEIVRAAQADLIQDHVKKLIHEKCEEVDLADFESSQYHDRLEQATSDGASRPISLLESIGSSLQNTIAILVMAGLLMRYGVWLPFAVLIGSLPALLVIVRFDRQFHSWWRGTTDQRRWIQYFDMLVTHPFTVTEVRAFNLSPFFQSRYHALRRQLRAERLSQLKRLGFAKLGASLVSFFILAIAISWVGLRAFQGALTLGDMALFYQAFMQSQVVMRSMLMNLGRIIKDRLFLSVLFEFLDLRSAMPESDPAVELPSVIKKGIFFDNITFSYPGSAKPIFSNFSLFVPAGKVVSIVGTNGSGKTTLIKLLCRFYEVDGGKIEIDGTDVRMFSKKELFRLFTVTFQMPLHFDATVRDSIAYGDISRQIPGSEMAVAVRNAGAMDFIEHLPSGLETLLGKTHQAGVTLSGGQWQRLALARAYVRQAPIVLLDEPTSALDSWSESDWFERFRLMIAGRTAILITHRFTIAMRADIIFVMDDGEITETGTHEELLRVNGAYARSWRGQQFSSQAPPFDYQDANGCRQQEEVS